MKNYIKHILMALGLAGLFGCDSKKMPLPKEIAHEQFSVGQVWRYKTRPSEPDSKLIIGKITQIGKTNMVIHIKIDGLNVKNPNLPDGLSKFIGHSPISEDSLKSCVTELVGNDGDLDGFAEGYETWLDAHINESAGFFTTNVSEIVTFIEEAINQ